MKKGGKRMKKENSRLDILEQKMIYWSQHKF